MALFDQGSPKVHAPSYNYIVCIAPLKMLRSPLDMTIYSWISIPTIVQAKVILRKQTIAKRLPRSINVIYVSMSATLHIFQLSCRDCQKPWPVGNIQICQDTPWVPDPPETVCSPPRLARCPQTAAGWRLPPAARPGDFFISASYGMLWPLMST